MKELPVEFVARMKQLMSAEEFRLYEESYQQNAVRAFRVNTEKISVKDFAEIDPFSSGRVPYVETGFYLDYDKVGNHPFHHAGMIYVQDPGAMAPAECLEVNTVFCHELVFPVSCFDVTFIVVAENRLLIAVRSYTTP